MGDHRFAATTRAADKGEAGRIGLPGGKVDAGETAIEALIRECLEEGWSINPTGRDPIHTQLVDGKEVQWFLAHANGQLDDYKEKGRIAPVVATVRDVVESGYGNENVPLIRATMTDKKEWELMDTLQAKKAADIASGAYDPDFNSWDDDYENS